MEQPIGSSPITKKPSFVGMSFPEAMQAVIDHKKVTKMEWGNSSIYGELKDGILQLHKDDGSFYSWIVSEGDLMGLDWICLADQNDQNLKN